VAKSFDNLTKGWSAKRLARVEARAEQLIGREDARRCRKRLDTTRRRGVIQRRAANL
jgi:hypothetical protein